MQPCDGWSRGEEGPPDAPKPGAIAPLFPLPNVFLFPGMSMPLHIFEPRYRQMIEDTLDGPGRIVMGTVLEGCHDDLAGSPPVHHIAGLGEIMRHERLPDGRFLIMLVGITRVLIRETPSDRLYRKVEAIPLRERPADEARAPALRAKLLEAIDARSPEPLELSGEVPLGQLADILLLLMQPPQATMQELFSCVSVEDRAKRALAAHASLPLHPKTPRKGRGPAGGLA
jgi:Lon protease-like protein